MVIKQLQADLPSWGKKARGVNLSFC